MDQETYASLLLNRLPEMGVVKFQKLLSYFGSAANAIQSGLDHWIETEQFTQESIDQLQSQFDQKRTEQELEVEYVIKNKIRVFLIHQSGYPERLIHTYRPPSVIYVKGDVPSWNVPSVALVGSRHCSFYGEKVAKQLATELSALGVVTLSGLARGIDTHVHESTLRANGTTWAVIGSGLSKLYPPENKKLAEQIEKNGAIISEFPVATVPHPSNFPRRNRIIAGLSLGTVLIEGTEKSGALITARLAAEEGRDVFAVPGPISSSLSVAPHRLLRLGAKMVESAADIVSEFSDFDRKNLFTSNFPSFCDAKVVSTLEKNILSFIGVDPIFREDLFEKFSDHKDTLASRLLEMEMNGLIKSLPGGRVVKN